MGLIENMKRNASYQDSDVFRPGTFNPGLFALNKKKLKALQPRLFSMRLIYPKLDDWQTYYSQLNSGDLSTGVVVSESPLLVACYTDDMDAVAVQCYPEELGKKLGWTEGTKLIVTCAYNLPWMKANKDLDCGSRNCGKFKAFGPIVADLYTDNTERLNRKKQEIPQEMWEYTYALGRQYLANHPGMARNGLGFAYADAVPLEKITFKCKLDKYI